MKKVLSNVDFFYMQTKKDAERIIEIGADQHKVAVMGNFKFDIEINKKAHAGWQNSIQGDILLAASTHEGEEEIVLDGYELIMNRAQYIKHMTENKGQQLQSSDITLIIAPRHPERFDKVAEILKKRNLEFIKRTDIDSVPEGDIIPSIILLDTIGELSGLFSVATIAYIGGSLVPKGGHNIMEPAYWSKPAIFGPHMENFPIAKDFLESAAALQVKDANDIAEAVLELLHNSARISSMGRNAKVIVENNTGAVSKAIELVRGYIGTS
jgi:3-deoxy-D-manno-octulosonic-acid transferase